MASVPSIPVEEHPAKTAGEERRETVAPKSRAERLAEAQAWVLEHHATTFEKLAK